MAVPYTFSTATGSLPLSQLDSNFSTAITIGNTAVVLGDSITTINNLTLANVSITSVSTAFPNGYLANSNVIVGTTTLTLGSTVTSINGLSLSNVTISSGNVTISNVTTTNVTATTANVTTANVGTLVVIGNETVGGNTTVTGNITAAKGTFTSANVSGAANVSTLAVVINATIGGNATVTGNVTAAKLIPTGTSVTGNGLYLPAANALGLSTNGTNAVYIDASQNVGIGVTSPSYKLQTTNSLAVTAASGQQYFLIGNQDGGGTNKPAIISGVNANLVFGNGSSWTAAGGGTLTEYMRIDNTGRLLIGTTSASGSNYLQVNSDSLINGLTVGKGAGAVATNTAVGVSALAANTIGAENNAVGVNAMLSTTTGSSNVAFGTNALRTNISGGENTALGHQVLYANTGSYNTGAGTNTLRFNTSGANNTAFGYNSLFSNTTASNNTAVGFQAGYNATGAVMTAIGYQAGYSNTDAGGVTTFVGYQAGKANTSGYGVAIGGNTLLSNTTGNSYVAVGNNALRSNTTGAANTAVGESALYYTTTSYNTAVGYQAGYTQTTAAQNAFFGYQAGYGVTTGSKNVILGSYQGSAAPISATGSNYIVLSDGDGNVRQTIDSSGNVGIGTSSPTAFGAGYTNLAVSGSTSGVVQAINSGNSVTAEMICGTDTGRIGTRTNHALVLKTNDTERMRIDSSGNAYIETGLLWQYAPTPTTKAAAATLTAAELATDIITLTGTTYTITLPTGTALDTYYTGVPAVNIGYDFHIVNTASGIVTIAVGASGMTSVGLLTVAATVSAHFRLRRTAANTYILYRLS